MPLFLCPSSKPIFNSEPDSRSPPKRLIPARRCLQRLDKRPTIRLPSHESRKGFHMRPRPVEQFRNQKGAEVSERILVHRGVVVLEDDLAVSAGCALIEGVAGEVFGPDVVGVDFRALEREIC
jgi:hypothetical protein